MGTGHDLALGPQGHGLAARQGGSRRNIAFAGICTLKRVLSL